MSYLADAWITDKAGIYTHFDQHGYPDQIEINSAHVRLKRTGNQWAGTITTADNTGQVVFTIHDDPEGTP